MTISPVILLVFVVLISACAPRPFRAASMYEKIDRHKMVAIIPPQVYIQLRPGQMKKISPSEHADMEQRASAAVQEAIYNWILRKQGRMKYSVAFQDIAVTNAKLRNENVDYTSMRAMDAKKIAALLGVDGVIDMSINTDKPMSDGAAIAIYALFGVMGSTNNTTATTSIRDGASGELLWRMTLRAQGSVGSSPVQLTEMVMRRAARRFPYRMP